MHPIVIVYINRWTLKDIEEATFTRTYDEDGNIIGYYFSLQPDRNLANENWFKECKKGEQIAWEETLEALTSE